MRESEANGGVITVGRRVSLDCKAEITIQRDNAVRRIAPFATSRANVLGEGHGGGSRSRRS